MIPKLRLKSRISLLLLLAMALLTQALLPMLIPKASASGVLTNSFVRFDTMTANTQTTGTVCAKPATTATEAGVWVTFPTGYTVSSTVGNWTVSTATTTGWPAGAVAWITPGAPTGAGDFTISGQRVGFQSGDLTVGTLYCFNWTNSAALKTNSSVANDQTGTIETRNNTPAAIDDGTYATATVSSSNISVTASINQSFQMSFAGGSTDALGTLTTGSVANSATVTATVNTNAKNGWMAWAKDANTGLNSAAAGFTIASTGVNSASQALVAGTAGYNMGVAFSQTGGTCTAGSAVNGNFDKAGGSNKGGGLDTTLRTILACGGTSNAGVITPTMFAAIDGSTPAAADYADTVTIVGAGIF